MRILFGDILISSDRNEPTVFFLQNYVDPKKQLCTTDIVMRIGARLKIFKNKKSIII